MAIDGWEDHERRSSTSEAVSLTACCSLGAAIAAAQPFMVDTASGVEEEPRRKDHNFVLSFVQAAHRAAREL